MTSLLALGGRFITSPWAALAGLGGGALFGLWAPEKAALLAPPGKLYLSLLQMCVMPIIVTAIAGSLARIALLGEGSTVSLGRMGLIFVGGLFSVAALAFTVGVIFEPGGGLELSQRAFLAQQVFQFESHSGTASVNGLWALADKIVPSNIFRSAASGDTLAVLVFSVLLGLGLGCLDKKQSSLAIDLFETFYNALLRIMKWVLAVLPLGLFALMAGQVGQGAIGSVLMQMGWIVSSFYMLAFLLAGVMTLLVSWRRRMTPWRVLAGLRTPLMTAFGTSSSLAALPSTLNSCETALGIKRHSAQLVLPVGFSLNPLGNVLHVVISSLFILQLYGLQTGLEAGIVLIFGGVLVACAMAGSPGIASISLLASLLAPLGVPVEVALVLLIALDPIFDPMLTLLNVYGNVTATSLIEERPGAAIS